MAALRPPAGELVEAALRPLLAEEIKAAEGWPELHLEPASWIEGDQVWVLELQPYDSPKVDGNLEEIPQLATDGGEITKQCLCQSEMPSPNPLAPVSLQEKDNLLVNACESCQKSTQETGQSTSIKNKHICPHCGKAYRWPSDLARHLRVHHGKKATKQRECQSESGPFIPVPLPLKEENTFVSAVSVSRPKSKLRTDWNTHTKNSYFCDLCEKSYQWRCNLVRHQRVYHKIKTGKQKESQSEASLLVSVSLQENMFVSPESTLKSKLTTNRSTHPQELHFCDQCTKVYRWRCDLVRHRRVHHDIKTGKQRKSQSEASLLISVSLQENMFVSPESTFQPKLEPMTDQSSHTKIQHICHLCGKVCRWPSDLARHQDRCYRRKTDEQREACLSDPVLFQMKEENTFVSPASALRPKTKLMTNCNTRINNLHICDRCGMGYQWLSHLVLHQSIHHGIKAGKQREKWSEGSPFVSISLQEGNTFVSSEATFRPKSKLTTNQDTHTKNLHICDQCAKTYRWRCDLVRHQRMHHDTKAESTFKSKSKLTTNRNTHPQKLHFCDQCTKVYRWRCDLVRHKRVHHDIKAGKQRESQTEASPFVSAALPQQAEKTFVSPESTFTPKSMLTSDQGTCIKKQHICPHCGKVCRWPSELARHQRVHSDRKATKWKECQSGQLVPDPLCLKEQKSLKSVSPESLFRPKLDPTTGQSTCTKDQHSCDQCERGCRKSCELAQNDQCHHSGQIATRQGQSQSASYSCSALAPISWPLQTKNTFADFCETVRQKLKPMTDQCTCDRHLPTCDQGKKGFQCPSEPMHHDQCVCSGEKAAVQNLQRYDHSGKCFRCPSDLASCLFLRFGKHATIQRLCQSEAHDSSPLASIPVQVKNVFANSLEIFSPMTLLMADQSTHAMNICNQNQNGFWWWSSEAVQHPHVPSGGKVAGGSQFYSKGGSPSHFVSYSLQTGYTAANFSKLFYPNSQLVIDQSTHVHGCGNAFQQFLALDQHQHVHSGVELARQGHSQSAACSSRPIASIPLMLQDENMFTNSKQMRAQNIETQNLHICSHSRIGFQLHSEPSQHPCVHSWGGLARGDQCQSKVHDPCLSMSVTASLKVISTFASCQKAIGQSPKQMTDWCAHSIGDHSGEGFHWSSDHTRHAHNDSRERPHSCAICGSQFTRKVQLVKHLRLHKEIHDSDGEEEDKRYQGGCGEEVPREDVSTEQLQWLSLQGTQELCELFATSKACKYDACLTGASSSSEPPPPNSIWEIGASGQPYILSLGHFYECGDCMTYDSSTTDTQPSEQSSLSVDDTDCSDLISPVGCDTSTPMVLSAAWGADENGEDMLKKEGFPANPVASRQARLPSATAGQNLKVNSSLSKKQDPPLVGEDKPYACPKCLKQFVDKYNFKRHIVIHQKKKPHRCKTCGDCFAHRSYLLKHQRRHTQYSLSSAGKTVAMASLSYHTCPSKHATSHPGLQSPDQPHH